ncbi:MAG: hypothetical protein IT464_08590 [Planctomycetes bacterium]|nr:hypothetical protein [Planctomycetota bacterium]
MMFLNNTEIGTVTRVVGIEPGVECIVIENGIGDVKVEPGRPGIVEVVARFKASRDAAPVSDRDVEITQGDGCMKIRASDAAIGARRVSYEVRVPMAINLKVKVAVGAIDAKGLSGEHNLRTGVGVITVEAERIAGNSHFRVGTGKANIATHRLEGRAEGQIGAGNLTLTAGSAMLESANFKAATGNIHLHLPVTYIGQIDFKSAMGGVKLNNDIHLVPLQTTLVGSRAKGALGQGPGLIAASVAVGTISLERK